MPNKNIVFDLYIHLLYHFHFCFDLGAIVNSCTTRLAEQAPVDPNYPTLQNNRNKIQRIPKKNDEQLSTPFRLIELKTSNELLTKRNRTLV